MTRPEETNKYTTVYQLHSILLYDVLSFFAGRYQLACLVWRVCVIFDIKLIGYKVCPVWEYTKCYMYKIGDIPVGVRNPWHSGKCVC